jgi:hypothetical protein
MTSKSLDAIAATAGTRVAEEQRRRSLGLFWFRGAPLIAESSQPVTLSMRDRRDISEKLGKLSDD